MGTSTVTFGGEKGDLRLRGKSAKGTGYSKFRFGNSTKVSCNGDIRTLVRYKNYAITNTSEAQFRNLFYGCTALTQAPELPATTLAEYCYYRMFEGCKNLNQITMLATDISAYCCLSGWLNGVSSTGTFIKAKNMNSLSTGSSGIPKGWTVIDR